MFVYVITQKNKPLMPCKPAIARLLLKDGKAKVKHRAPFTRELAIGLNTVLYKRHISAGDYQKTKGAHSEKAIPTGKLFDLRKNDLIKNQKITGFVKGKRSSGYFAIADIHGNKIQASANMKNQTVRISARTTTITQLEVAKPSLG